MLDQEEPSGADTWSGTLDSTGHQGWRPPGASDLAGLASIGLRTRKLRPALSALGIAIEVAAIGAVLVLARSSQAGLNAEIAQLGTNPLTVTSGQTFTGQAAELAIGAIAGLLPAIRAARLSPREAQWSL